MRSFFLYVLFGASLCCNSCAEKNKKNDEKKNDPVNFTQPKKSIDRVSDFKNILTAEQVDILDATLAKHDADAGNEIAIIILDPDPNIIKTGEDFNAYSLALFNKWEIGKKRKNNGIGILLCPNLRRVRIEVGYGLESKLTNDEAKAIIDSVMLPSFKNADYYKGLSSGLAAIINEIK
jgi:uncharacterized protein